MLTLNSTTYPDAIIDLEGVYYIVSNSTSLDRWNWKQDVDSTIEVGIYYDSDYQRWRITTQFADVIQANNVSSGNSKLPPYSQDADEDVYTSWYSINTDEIIGMELWCTDSATTQTPNPTPVPVFTTTADMYPNCTMLVVSSTSNPSNRDALVDLQLSLDDPSTLDGRGIWVSTDEDYVISWYGTNDRWTFYDDTNDELYLADTSLSTLSDPIGSAEWTYIGSTAVVYELDIECNTGEPTVVGTPSPTTYADPCAFPGKVVLC